MELVMFITMLLFTGFCTILIVVAAFSIVFKKEDVEPPNATTAQTDFHDRKTLV